MSCPLHFRPALRAGVKCGDITALSRSFFEPSALPWSWALCRSLILQNRGQEGGQRTAERLGGSAQPLRVSSGAAFHYRRARCSSLTAAHKGPNTALHSFGGNGYHSAHREGTNSPKGADGRSTFEAALGQDYWQIKSARNSKCHPFPIVRFGSNSGWDASPPSGYFFTTRFVLQ